MCGRSHGLLVPGCWDKAAAADSWTRASVVAGLTCGKHHGSTWETYSTLGWSTLAPMKWLCKKKMSLLQDEPVKTLPGHYTLQQCPAFVRMPSQLNSHAVTNSLLGLWRATRSPWFKKVTGFTFHIVLSSLGIDSISKITIAGPAGLPLTRISVSMNLNRWTEDICQCKNPLK